MYLTNNYSEKNINHLQNKDGAALSLSELV